MKKLLIFTFLFIFSFLSKAQDIDSNLVYETFELNPYRAIIDTTSQDSVWQIGQPQKLNGFSMAYSGVKAIITDTINSYPINHTSCFYFRFDNLPFYWSGMCRNMQLDFYHKLQCDSLTEGGYIEISYDSGLTFHNIVDDDDLYWNTWDYNQTYGDLFYSKQDTLNNGTPAFTGNWAD